MRGKEDAKPTGHTESKGNANERSKIPKRYKLGVKSARKKKSC